MNSCSSHITLLSPHSDDIALSLGGWLAYLQANNPSALKSIEIYTGFNISSSTPHISSTDGKSAQSSILRLKEESDFCDVFGVKLSIANLPDTSVLNINYLAPIELENDFRYVKLIDYFFSLMPNNNIFCPISLGAHVDHRIFTQAAFKYVNEASLLVFYEDLPYATWFSEQERLQQIDEILGSDVSPFYCHLKVKERLKKRQNLKIYQSQLNEEEIELTIGYMEQSDNTSLERVWLYQPNDEKTAFLKTLGFEQFSSFTK